MAKAIIWCRVSTTEQELETQKKNLDEKAIKDGFKPSDLIHLGVEGASAIKMNELYQQEVNKLIETIDTEPDVTTVYVWEVSRLARNEVAFYQMKDKIVRKGIQLICFVPQLTLLNDNGEVNTGAEITLNLLVTMAKQEMEIKAKRFARGKKRLADEGKYNGGNIPFGYRVDKERGNLIVIDEENAELVREVFNLYEAGLSQTMIAKEFRRRNIPQINLNTANNILNNERYTGRKLLYPGSSYARSYPVLITPEQYDHCREIAKANSTNADKAHYIYYGHHLITCPVCGRNWVTTGTRVWYHCGDAHKPNKYLTGYNNKPQCTCRIGISINIMDSLLWYVAQKVQAKYIVNEANNDKIRYEKRIGELDTYLKAIDGRLEVCDRKRERITEAYIDGDLTKEQRFRKNASVDEERKNILIEQLKFQNEMEHIQALLKDVITIASLSNAKDVSKQLESIIQIRENISSISDDEERSRIVHKYIKDVSVENINVEYQFKIAGKKICKARYITIELYNGDKQYYIFVPNNGVNGAIHVSDENKKLYEKLKDMEYLKRFFDFSKKKRRDKARETELRKKERLYPQDKYIYGLNGLAEFLKTNSISTAYRWIAERGLLKDAVVCKYRGQMIIDKTKCLEIMEQEATNNIWVKKVLDRLNKKSKDEGI